MRPLNEKGGTKLKKEYSQGNVERILKSSVKIPASVDERIQTTYRELGLTEDNDKASDGHRSARY